MSNNELKLSKFDLGDKNMLSSLIECYKDAFAYKPWQEWKICNNCKKKFGKEDKNKFVLNFKCPNCSQELSDFWTYKQVEKDIKHELNHQLSSCYILTENNISVVGFCWGYVLDSMELEKHINLPNISKNLQKNFPNLKQFAYQDEIGMIKKYQGKKLAKLLFQARLNDFIKWGVNIGVVRTKTLPPTVTYLWYLRLGYKVIQEYNDEDGRVIMAINFNKLKFSN